MSNYVQGSKTTVTWSAFATLGVGAFSVGPTIDLTATVPFEVLLEVTSGVASNPATTSLGVTIYLQYSLDGTNWSSFQPATTVGATDMEFIGFVPVQDSSGATVKTFTTAGHPTCRWIRPVAYNGTGVVLNAGSLSWAPITGS